MASASGMVPSCLIQAVIDVTVKTIATNNKNAKLLNLYLWGSRCVPTGARHHFSSAVPDLTSDLLPRLNGTHDPKTSDWDFVAIVSDYEQPEMTVAVEGVAPCSDETHSDGFVHEFEVSIYDKDYFQWLVDKHVPWALPLLFHPKEATLQQEHTFKLHLIIPRLRRALHMNTTVNLQQAKIKFAENGEKRRSMKRIFHVMQMNIWATQLAEHDRLVDRNVGNPFYFTMKEFLEDQDAEFVALDPKKHWQYFERCWRPIMDSLESRFNALANHYVPFEQEYAERHSVPIIKSASHQTERANQHLHPVGAPLCVLSYLERHGLEGLVRNMAITVKPHPKYPDRIFHLRFDREMSPLDSRITCECNSLILERISADNRSSFRVLAYPFFRFFSSTHSESAPIDWDSSRLEAQEWVDGRLVILYTVDGEWEVASSRSADGSNTIFEGEQRTSIASKFWSLFKELNYTLPEDKHKCYMFEMVLKDSPVIMHYPEDRLVFLSARDVASLLEEKGDDLAARYGWMYPHRISGAELLSQKVERLKSVRGPTPPKSGLPPPVLNVQDIEITSSESWRDRAGYVVVQESPGCASFVRINVRSPLIQKLLQFRFASRFQQETLLLLNFAMYGAYNLATLSKCPYKPSADAESNCCELFELVRKDFDDLCLQVDQAVAFIDSTTESKGPKEFSAKAEKLYRNIAHFVNWTKQRGCSAKQFFAERTWSSKTVTALNNWWIQSHQTARAAHQQYRHFCYK